MQEAKQIISDSKNIYIIANHQPEAICCALALFYSLNNLEKNVNLITNQPDSHFPENLNFLTPSLDFISHPKNFVISVPSSVATISQIYYEKDNEALKIHLGVESGSIKKDNLSFYFYEPKPDLIITVGIKNYAKELSENLNSFAFLMESDILNIDNSQENQKFGKINLVEQISIPEIIFGLLENISKEAAECLLAGIIIYTENFKKNLTAEVFETAGNLMKKGANLQNIINNLYNNN